MAKEDEIEGLAPDQPFADAGRVIVAHRFAAMWKHREGTLDGDEEALHDMRVASRRLRAALDVFAAAFPRHEYRALHRLTARLTDELGAVRDHDVMLLNLRGHRESAEPDEYSGIDNLSAALDAERTLARRALRRFFGTLDDERYAERMEAISR